MGIADDLEECQRSSFAGVMIGTICGAVFGVGTYGALLLVLVLFCFQVDIHTFLTCVWLVGIVFPLVGWRDGAAEAGKVSGLTSDLAKMGTKLKDPTIMRYFFRTQMATTAQFAAFFTVYSTTKCLLSNKSDLDKYAIYGAAAAAGIGPFIPSRLFRRNLPWAGALICMDIYSSYTREQELAQQEKMTGRRRRS